MFLDDLFHKIIFRVILYYEAERGLVIVGLCDLYIFAIV